MSLDIGSGKGYPSSALSNFAGSLLLMVYNANQWKGSYNL